MSSDFDQKLEYQILHVSCLLHYSDFLFALCQRMCTGRGTESFVYLLNAGISLRSPHGVNVGLTRSTSRTMDYSQLLSFGSPPFPEKR